MKAISVSMKKRYKKRASYSYRTATTAYTCYVPILGDSAGAGRTTAIRSFEDLGFEAIDNLPLDLVKSVLKPKKASEKIAIGLDTRGRDFSVEGLLGLLRSLSSLEHVDFELLYLSCTMEVLLRRYSETRRRHPLADGKSPNVGVEQELILLEPIRQKADILIETSAPVSYTHLTLQTNREV